MFGKITERQYWIQIQFFFQNVLIFKKTKTKTLIRWNSTKSNYA